MNVALIGAGRIELVAAAELADFVLLVQCVDIDETKIDALKAGSVPFHEPGLMELLEKNRTSAAAALLKHERLSFLMIPTRQLRAPMPSPCSPNGTSFAS